MTAERLRETIERLKAVAADHDGPEVEAYREKAAELRLELAVAGAAEHLTPDTRNEIALPDVSRLTPEERAALEIELQQTFQIMETEARAIHEWASRLAREKRRMLRRRAAEAEAE